MKCDKCGNSLLDQEMFCKKCGHEQAYHQQKKALYEAEEKQKSFVKRKCHSPLLLITAILFTLITFFSLPSIIPAIFMIITTVGLWRCYLAKSDETLIKGLGNMKAFDMFIRGIGYFISGISILAFIFYSISIVLSCTQINKTSGSSEAILPFILAWAVTLVGIGIFVGIIELFCKIFHRRIAFLQSLKSCVVDGAQYGLSFSKFGSYFIGIMLILPAFGSVISSIIAFGSIASIEGILMSALGSLEIEGMSEILSMMDSVIAFVSSLGILLPIFTILGSLGNICFGVYYILSAEWMSSAKKESFILFKNTDQEKKKLAEIEKETRQQIRLFNQAKEQSETKANEKKADTADADENICYSIAINGKASNPISVKDLRAMALSGELLRESLLWRRGMSAWTRADEIAELADSFPPPIDMPEAELGTVEAPEIPAIDAPTEEAPVEETPAEEAPAEEVPAEEVPAEETPAEETPAEETPAEEAPTEETPAEETPAEETPAEETPAEEVPAEETLTEETPAEEAPAEETPAEEAPAEETPVEETPVEENAEE